MSADNSMNTRQSPGRVKWRRFAYAAVPAVVIAGTLVGLTAKGALASSISVSGQEYTVTADQLTGHGFVQFGNQIYSTQNGKQVPVPVITTGLARATLKNLCQSVSVGPVTMRLTAGTGTQPVSATNMIVDASGQTGSLATFKNVVTGQDAGTLSEDGSTAGASGGFGQQADSVVIDNLNQKTWLTTAGTFTLPNLSLGFGGGC